MTVGFSGDPEASWSILLEADLTEAPDPELVSARMSALATTVRTPSDWDGVRTSFADTRYETGDPLVRVAVGGHRLLIAAHHAAVDGLGLLALLGIALDRPVHSSATGVADRPVRGSYVACMLDRLREAVFTPPTRIRPLRGTGAAGDQLVSRELPRMALGSTRLTFAALQATRKWNVGDHDRIVAAVGASQQGGANPRPELASALMRLRLPYDADEAVVRGILAAAAPETGFPSVHNPLARLGMRLLAPRLGSTFLVSNLGVVDAGVRALWFYPTASGRSGVSFGAVTTGQTTIVTVRARRRDFDAAAAGELLDLLCDAAAPAHTPHP